MKPRTHITFAILAASSLSLPAADLLWDGGNLGGTGDGASTYASGTWSTANANWDQGAGLSRVAWSNTGQDGENLDNAIFAGPYTTGTKTVTIGSDITVNQIQVLTGSTGANRYDIGASNAQNDFAISPSAAPTVPPSRPSPAAPPASSTPISTPRSPAIFPPRAAWSSLTARTSPPRPRAAASHSPMATTTSPVTSSWPQATLALPEMPPSVPPRTGSS